MGWRARMFGIVAALSVGGAWFAASAQAVGWVDLVMSPRLAPLRQIPSLRSQQMASALSPGSHTPRLLPHEKRCQSVWHRWAGRSAPCRRFPGTDLFSGRRRARMGRRHSRGSGTPTRSTWRTSRRDHDLHRGDAGADPGRRSSDDIRLAVTSGGGSGHRRLSVWTGRQPHLGPQSRAGRLDASARAGVGDGGAVDHGSFDAMGHGPAFNGADIVTSGGDLYVAWQRSRRERRRRRLNDHR